MSQRKSALRTSNCVDLLPPIHCCVWASPHAPCTAVVFARIASGCTRSRQRCKAVTTATNHSSAEHHQTSICCSGWHLRCGCPLSTPIAAGARFLRARASVCRRITMHKHKTVSALADSFWRLCNQAAGSIISAPFDGTVISP